MTTRRRLLFGLLAVFIALSVGGWELWPRPPSRITRENAARIEEGMTIAQVEMLLGGAARDDSTGRVRDDWAVPFAWSGRAPSNPSVWRSDSAEIEIEFNSEGCV